MTKLRGKIMQIIQLSTRKKQALALSILVTVIALTFFATKAWAMSGDNAAASHAKPSVYEEYKIIKLAPSTTTTTTTTTVPVVRNFRSTESKSTKQAVRLPSPEDVNYVAPVAPPQGDWVAQCHAWAAQAGIELPPAAITLIGRESSCNPSVMNHGGSGAGGIPQALPASKMGCSMDAAGAPCQLRWMLSYVTSRYGGWDNALAHSLSKNWY